MIEIHSGSTIKKQWKVNRNQPVIHLWLRMSLNPVSWNAIDIFWIDLEFFIFFIFIFYLLIILWGIQQIIKSHFSLSFSFVNGFWFVRKSYCQFLFNFPDSCVHMLVPQVNACWHILFSFNFLILNSTNYPDPVVTRIIYELQNLEPKECQDEDITSIWLQRNIEEIPVLKLFLFNDLQRRQIHFG